MYPLLTYDTILQSNNIFSQFINLEKYMILEFKNFLTVRKFWNEI